MYFLCRLLCQTARTPSFEQVSRFIQFSRLMARVYPSRMPGDSRHTRRSTRVPLKVAIEVIRGDVQLYCDGETIVVNLHGALIATAIELAVGMKIAIHVLLTNQRANARVVYVDPADVLHCGVELEQPRNIWGVPLAPDDWEEASTEHLR